MTTRPGKVRHPGTVLLLCVVTFGVYWFVWLYKAFEEVAQWYGREVRARQAVTTLAVLWGAQLLVAFAFLVAFVGGVIQVAAGDASQALTARQVERILLQLLPLLAMGAVIMVAFYLLQARYVKRATEVVNAAAAQLPRAPQAPAGLAFAFCVLYAISVIPFLGYVTGVIALVLAIVWVVQVQNAMNHYWRGALAPPPPPVSAPARPRPAGPRRT